MIPSVGSAVDNLVASAQGWVPLLPDFWMTLFNAVEKMMIILQSPVDAQDQPGKEICPAGALPFKV